MSTESRLNVSPRMDARALHLDITYRNDLREPVYVMALLYDWYGILAPHDPSAPPTAQLAFVFWNDPDRILIVSGESAPPPDGVNPYAPRRPHGYRLGPGGTFKNQLSLRVPLLEWHAYGKPKSTDTVQVSTHTVRYRLEVVRSSQASYQDEHPSYRGVWRVSGPSIQEQVDIELPAPVTLLKRIDRDFKRLR